MNCTEYLAALERAGISVTPDVSAFTAAVWDAATKAEREACAELCYDEYREGGFWAAQCCRERILAR